MRQVPQGGIPDSYGPVQADRSQVPSVRVKSYVSDPVGVSGEAEGASIAPGVPNLDRLILPGGGQPPAVRAEQDAVDRARMPAQGQGLLPGRRVPDLDGLI